MSDLLLPGAEGARPATMVSIALATYNGGAFLADQLDSFLAQTRLPDELVIGDDGSSDDTVALVEDFTRRAPFPVRLAVNRPNLGPARNFGATIARCRGDIILLSDQDDIWRPDKVAALVGYLEAHPACLLVTHDGALVDEAGQLLGPTLGSQIEAAGGRAARDLVAGCCMAIDARLAALFEPMPRTPEHDAWLHAAADALQARAYLAAALTLYRRHGANVSQSYMSGRGRATRWLRFQERARRALTEPALTSIESSAAAQEDLLAALQRHRGNLAHAVGYAATDRAIAVVAARLATNQRRAAIFRAPRNRRPGLFLAAARAGDYTGLDGALSLGRDMVNAVLARRPA